MNYEEAKKTIDINILFQELREYVATQPLHRKSQLTRQEALDIIDNVIAAESKFKNPRFEIFDFTMREMLNKVMDGDPITYTCPHIARWLAVRRFVLSDPAIRGAT